MLQDRNNLDAGLEAVCAVDPVHGIRELPTESILLEVQNPDRNKVECPGNLKVWILIRRGGILNVTRVPPLVQIFLRAQRTNHVFSFKVREAKYVQQVRPECVGVVNGDYFGVGGRRGTAPAQHATVEKRVVRSRVVQQKAA